MQCLNWSFRNCRWPQLHARRRVCCMLSGSTGEETCCTSCVLHAVVAIGNDTTSISSNISSVSARQCSDSIPEGRLPRCPAERPPSSRPAKSSMSSSSSSSSLLKSTSLSSRYSTCSSCTQQYSAALLCDHGCQHQQGLSCQHPAAAHIQTGKCYGAACPGSDATLQQP